MDKTTMQNPTGKLTSRQQEFLQSLTTLCKIRKQAVSYVDVASDMKVSKWTAYDILHDLYERGFLRMEHEIRTGKGRSRIFYSPAENTLRVREDTGDAAEHRTLKWLTGKINQYAGEGVAESIGIEARRVSREKNPFQVVLHISLMVVLFVRVFGVDIDRLVSVRALAASSVSADTVLRLLSEVMFSFMRNEEWLMTHLGLSQQSIQEFTKCEESFVASVVQLSAGEKRLVVSVIGRAFA
jgi:predicted transcriptional regulator